MAIAQRWASQAAQDALLRYNPQRSALAQQIREATETYGGTVRAARTTAQETQRSAQRALPLLHAAYGAADAATQPGVTLVSNQLAQPGVDPSLRAGAANEVQQQIANLAKARSSAESTMVDRGVRAREGAQFAQLNAQNTLARTLTALFGRGQSLSQEQGAFAQSEAEKLAHEAEGLEQRERASQRTAQSSREGNAQQERASERGAQTSRANAQESAQAKREAARKAGPNYTAPGVKEQDVTQHNSARSNIEKIRHEAFTQIRANHHNYNEALELLQTPIKTKAFTRGAYSNNAQLRAGVDLAYFGGLGAGTIKQLHQEGFSVGKLGYPAYHAPAPQGNFFDVVRKAAESLRGK